MWAVPASHISPRTVQTPLSPGQQFNTSPPDSLHSRHRIPVPCRQLHPPKSPLYRPAVLRAIDKPYVTSTVSSPSSSPKLQVEHIDACKREGDSSSEDGFDLDFDEDVCEEDEGVKCTGAPTRSHWKPDAAATVCDSPNCVREFGTWTRRHHCRRCGNVFCFQHIPYSLPLSQNARIHPRGVRSKACDGCFNDYRRLRAARRNNSLSSESTSSSLSTSSPIMTRGVKPMGRSTDPVPNKVGSYVGSVPRDWSWSTF